MTNGPQRLPPLPAVDRRVSLDLDGTYSPEEFAVLKKGLEPRAMEDKWAIDYDAPWLYFRRSGTGYCVFAIRLQETGPGGGARIVESWVSRNGDEYRSQSLEDDKTTLRFLIDGFLLEKPLSAPRMVVAVPDAADAPPPDQGLIARFHRWFYRRH